ncbi:hypothetical protein ACPOL_3636 [Acidisarcina polymorpha]|uniref:Uncharacterized protein n=1 Tax=Acidisarcina polymorpha TaxID=2211140 RepID=A0A2Z5G1G5_9BACT|nr:chitobiase/beta-hexosaminidase C-terminal domain-containing protein [Acidisarcina polymorpha]AXC12919.1 hypothetical protein ACPOL_3636 [Acidisarcina polymorpha]
MSILQQTLALLCRVQRTTFSMKSRHLRQPLTGMLLVALFSLGYPAAAQVNVLTGHNDIGRTGQNLNETILTPSTVNSSQFGKLFSWPVDGGVYPQPLYVSHLTIPGKGVHNVVYVGTTHDSVYAFDADSNGGANSVPLWQVSLLTNTTPAGTYTPVYGICGTPVIDLSTNTMYLVSSEEKVSNSTYPFRIHALDITTGAEKFGGPLQVQGGVPGTGSGSVNGWLAFDGVYERQRPSLLLLNGVVYAAFGSVNDTGPWHGWIFSYNAANLSPIDVYSTAPNGSGAGIWMGGSGLAAEVNDPSKPYGRMFFAVGNGSNSAAAPPYNNSMSYGMSVVDLDLTGGVMNVTDQFTQSDWARRNGQDGDLGSAGPVLLPTQTLASGKTVSTLVQIGKVGTFYVLDRNHLGGYNANSNQIVQELQTPESGEQQWGAGIWGSSAYWNQNIYYGGHNPGAANPLIAYSFRNGQMSAGPTSQSHETFAYPGPTPSVSSNGGQNGIVWVIDNSQYHVGPGVLYAYDATNLGNTLYSSNDNLSRDNPGGAVEFTVPTVANGKVYVGQAFQFSVYGLLNSPTAAAPIFNPPGGTFNGSEMVSLTSATPNAQIYYTTDGSTPSTESHLYTGPINVNSDETITAIANANHYLQSAAVSATYTDSTVTGNPIFSLTAGTYSGTQYLNLVDTTANATIFYTVDGSTPTTSSQHYTAGFPLIISVTETVRAMAISPHLPPSQVVSTTYTINPPYVIDFSQGFADSQAPMQFNGSTSLDDFRLQLTNGGTNQAGSAFYETPVNIQSFTTDFTLQLSNPVADGMTFTIQNVGAGALGGDGGGLGYNSIGKSLAIKFDLFSNAGEGPNSTGLYINGAEPTLPSISLVGTGINLHDGDYQLVHITYDGTNLVLTITDGTTLASWSHTFTNINIPAIVGGPTAYVGFTGGSGGFSSSQKVTYWTYLPGAPLVPNNPAGFDARSLALNGVAALAGTALHITNGGPNESGSAFFPTAVNLTSFTSDFDFVLTHGSSSTIGDGFTFVMQNDSVKAIQGSGGLLGYGGMPASVAIKFDTYNNAGEGNDSTGVYIDGATPTLPAINLTPHRVVLSSGDSLHAHIAYDGTTLTWTITDNTLPSKPSATNSQVINIPHILGGNVGYVGFTGGSGGATSIQSILDWTFASATN